MNTPTSTPDLAPDTDRPTGSNGATAAPLRHWEERLLEAFDDLYDSLVDPAEPFYDSDETRWRPLGTESRGATAGELAFSTEQQLREIRAECRMLAVTNEFAINGHENRISYLVGSGHTYRATAKKGQAVADDLLAQVQAVLDAFVTLNTWHKRQQEIVRRRDRDGEVFLRLFVAPDGITRMRFVEPGQVATPPERAGDPSATFGVQTDPDDVENVLGYYVDGRWVDAAEIQHRKAHVDSNVKRGLPLFYPVRKNLRRAEKLLRNMSVVAEIQSAIALIRKHHAGTRGSVQQFVQNEADASLSNPRTGRTSHFRRYAPGTILDAFAGTDYEFPVTGVDASRYVTVLQAELRAVASRLVMPEFMLSSDASNANYASTMVAEGPAVRMFQRLQHDLIEEDLELMRRVIANAVAFGRLSADALEAVEVQGTPPPLATRDRLREAQADQILVRSGAMSVQTMATRHGLDADKEAHLVRQMALASAATAGQTSGASLP